jgi:hypothetical protein
MPKYRPSPIRASDERPSRLRPEPNGSAELLKPCFLNVINSSDGYMASDNFLRTVESTALKSQETLSRLARRPAADLYAALAATVTTGSAFSLTETRANDADQLPRSGVVNPFDVYPSTDDFQRGGTDLGQRIFRRWSSVLHDFLCRGDNEDRELRERVIGAIVGKGGGAVALVAAVLVFSWPWARLSSCRRPSSREPSPARRVRPVPQRSRICRWFQCSCESSFSALALPMTIHHSVSNKPQGKSFNDYGRTYLKPGQSSDGGSFLLARQNAGCLYAAFS